jgi:hypothetical protein
MTNWKLIAEARELGISAASLEQIAPALEALERSFRPLAAAIPPEVEPAVIFRAAEDTE